MNDASTRPVSGLRLTRLTLPAACAAVLLFSTAVSFAQTFTLVLSNRWNVPAGTGGLSASGDNDRGIAINKTTSNVLWSTRSPNSVNVLNGADGSSLGAFNMTGVTGGTIFIDQVRVAEDGVVYAFNLQAANGSNPANWLKVYRWDSEAAALTTGGNLPPVVAFGPANPGPGTVTNRYGDSVDIRGSGTNTQIAISGSAAPTFAILTTTDGTNFTATQFALPAGTSAGDLAKGITFDGTNNVVYGKNNSSQNLRRIGFDLTTSNATLLSTIALGTSENNSTGTKYAEEQGVKFISAALTANAASPQNLKVYTINNPSTPTVSASVPFPSPNAANANLIGATDIGAGMVAGIIPNNGIQVQSIHFLSNVPPAIVTAPVGTTNLLTGGFYTLATSASGTAPLRLQWRLGGANVAGATNATLVLTNVSAANAGDYDVVVTNVAGAITSAVATIGLLPSVQTVIAGKLWQLPPGSRSYLTSDNNQRGMAFNAASNHVLIPNRAGGASIYVLNADTGANITNLNMTGVVDQSGALTGFPVVMAGVAEDGVVYAANLTTSGGGYTIYRWDTDAPGVPPVIAFGPADPTGGGQRIGDTFAVKGAGVDTRIFASTRSGTQVVVFTTTDGTNFTANVVDVGTAPNPAPAGFAGLGLAAGEGDTFWATSGTFLLRKVIYDLVNGTNDVLLALGGQTGNNIGADSANHMIASIGSGDTPSNLRVLDVSDPNLNAVLLDQEFFGSDNDNINGTGAVAFDVKGGRIFALDSNNGLVAVKYAGRVNIQTLGANQVVTWPVGTSVLQSNSVVTGSYSDVTGATSPYTNSSGSQLYFRLRR